MYKLTKIIKLFFLNISKLHFRTYDWFCADGPHMLMMMKKLSK